jgi:hypothetical protein
MLLYRPLRKISIIKKRKKIKTGQTHKQAKSFRRQLRKIKIKIKTKQKKHRKLVKSRKSKTKVNTPQNNNEEVPQQSVQTEDPSEVSQQNVQTEGPNEYDSGYDDGFKKGHYAGGEGLVDQLLPEATILPEVTLIDIILTGIEQMKSKFHPVMGTADVVSLILGAMDQGTPLSLVRLGDGELLTMAQETLISTEQVKVEGPFLEYAGVNIPDLEARDQLVEAVRCASVVGIPLLRLPNFQPLAFSVFRAYGLDFRQMKITHSTINYSIYLEHCLSTIVVGRRVLLIGNKAGPLAEIFAANGIYVAGVIASVQGMQDIPRVMIAVAAQDFDIALVSAGVPAVVIVHRIAVEMGKVAIDFGHLADSMVNGEAPYA